MFNTRQLIEIKRQYKLTDREIQIVKLISEGVESNADIAKQLGVELNTTKVHMANLYRKVGVNSKLAVVLKFAQG